MADQGRRQTDLKGSFQDKGSGSPSALKVLAVLALFPVGGGLLFVGGLTFVATLIGLAIATPGFIIFSPILVPAAIVIGLAVAGFLASGAFGITALSAISWIVSHLRRGILSPEHMGLAVPKQAREMAGQLGQKTKDLGHEIQSKVHDVRT